VTNVLRSTQSADYRGREGVPVSLREDTMRARAESALALKFPYRTRVENTKCVANIDVMRIIEVPF
jgi:hypothetical protein